MTEVVTAITQVGFPIVACCLTAWFVKYLTDQNLKETSDMRTEHKEEVAKMTEALNNNTLAIQRLIDKLDKEDSNEK